MFARVQHSVTIATRFDFRLPHVNIHANNQQHEHEYAN